MQPDERDGERKRRDDEEPDHGADVVEVSGCGAEHEKKADPHEPGQPLSGKNRRPACVRSQMSTDWRTSASRNGGIAQAA